MMMIFFFSVFGLIEFQIEVIVGIILCLIATILIFVYANGQIGHSYLMSPVILNLISGKFLNQLESSYQL